MTVTCEMHFVECVSHTNCYLHAAPAMGLEIFLDNVELCVYVHVYVCVHVFVCACVCYLCQS